MVYIREITTSSGLRIRSNHRTPIHETFREVFRARVYDPPGIGPPAAGSVVLDVGANVGLYSLHAATSWPGVRVHAFEPAPDSFELLRENVAENGLGDVITCHRLAVSGVDGAATLHLDRSSACDSLVPPPNEAATERQVGTVEVRTVTLDGALAAAEVGAADVLVKLDAEGSEYDILAGASDAALASVRRIAAEYHNYLYGDDRTYELAAVLARAGFEVFVQGDESEGMLHATRPADGS